MRLCQLALVRGQEADRRAESGGELLPHPLDGESYWARSIRPADPAPVGELLPVSAAVADQQSGPLVQDELQTTGGSGTRGPATLLRPPRAVTQHGSSPTPATPPASGKGTGGEHG